MQTLTIDFIQSLDGFGAADGWPGWWGLESPEYLEWLDSRPDKDSPLLMGATTYRLMSAFAATRTEGVESLDGVRKYVFSSTLDDPPTWANTILVREDAVAFTRRLKEESAEPLRTLGSLSLCRTLLASGLADRFRTVIFPVITGATGTDRILDGYPDVLLELVEARTFDGRTQLLEYVPRVLSGPPGS